MSDASPERTTSTQASAGEGKTNERGVWRRCSACKSDIALGATYYVCSVSTCNRKRTALAFCSVDCWEIHLPTERHREAWAVEERAPLTPEPKVDPASPGPKPRPSKVSETSSPPPRARASATESQARPSTIIRRASSTGASSRGAEERASSSSAAPASAVARARASDVSNDEILVVASRLKNYVKSVSGFNTSDRVLPILSAALRVICDEAIQNARRAERLTVLDRDVPRD